MRAQIAVGGTKHIQDVARPRAQRLSHADVVSEDLARRGGHVGNAVEQMLDEVVGK